MLKVNAGDSNVAIDITPVDASGTNIGLSGATNALLVITRLNAFQFSQSRSTVVPTVDNTNTFFQYVTTTTDFTEVGLYAIQPQWIDSSGGHRSASEVLISVEPRA